MLHILPTPRSIAAGLLVATLFAGCGSREGNGRPCVESVPASTAHRVASPEPAHRFDQPAPMQASGEPTRAEVFLVLSANADVPLSSGMHCDDIIGVDLDRAPLLGDWIAYNLSVMDEGPTAVTMECADADDRWNCDVYFEADLNGEDPWAWGVRLAIAKADRRPIPSSLMCLGAG